MSRYIDADAYAAEMKTRQDACKELLMDAAKEDDNWEPYANMSAMFSIFVEAKLTLDNMPTVDAVQVVRCRECKHYDGKWCLLLDMANSDMGDWYCAYGERRTE